MSNLAKELYCVRNSQSVELFAAKEEVKRLRAYVEADAKCPYCEGENKCMEDCTYEEDVGTNSECFQRMLAARKALWPGDINALI